MSLRITPVSRNVSIRPSIISPREYEDVLLPGFGFRVRLMNLLYDDENRRFIIQSENPEYRPPTFQPINGAELQENLLIYLRLPLDIEYENEQRVNANAPAKEKEMFRVTNEEYAKEFKNFTQLNPMEVTPFENISKLNDLFPEWFTRRGFDRIMGGNWRTWNISKINDLSYVFSPTTRIQSYIYKDIPDTFDEVIPWKTSHVTNMKGMFRGCTLYNQPLPAESFDTSNVKNMAGMFAGCQYYNQPLPKSFDTSNVTNMAGMFAFCQSYNQPLPELFDTSNVKNMESMFWNCWIYNQQLPESFDTSNVENMELMFSDCHEYNKPLPASFDTSKVTNMQFMFWKCFEYNQPFPGRFKLSHVEEEFQYGLFLECESLENKNKPTS